jgi:type IV pilus assembly protein PilP
MTPLTKAALALAVATLAACGGGEGSARPAAAKKPAAKTAKPAAASAAAAESPVARPAIATDYVYAYNPLGKRDPFRSPEELRRAAGAEGGTCSELLCQWDLDQLALKAVVTGDANPFAMLEDPQGRGHIVRRNSRVGRQGGKVTQILRDSITITEYFTQPDGKRAAMPREVQMVEDRAFAPATDLISGKTYE